MATIIAHAHGHHHHHDNNLRAAYVHVLADAATSVLAIAALVVAMYSGWVWADPAVGIVGSVVIASWAYGLIRASGAVLLDVNADKDLETVIRERHRDQGRPRHRPPSVAGRSRPSRRGDLGRLRSSAAACDLQAPARRPARPQPRDGRGGDLSASARAGWITSTAPDETTQADRSRTAWYSEPPGCCQSSLRAETARRCEVHSRWPCNLTLITASIALASPIFAAAPGRTRDELG